MTDRFKFRVWWEQENRYRIDVKIHPIEKFFRKGFVIEQCTGLKDKNGNLIYEGDIVKIPPDWDTYGMMSGAEREVYFFDGGFRLKPKDPHQGRGHWLEDIDGQLEIVGNIHQPREEKQ